MAATVGSVFDTQKNRIEERISHTIEVFLAQADPVWRETSFTSQNVMPTDQFGRDFEVIKIYQNAVAGVFESGGPRGDWTIYGDDNAVAFGSKMTLGSQARTFPDANDDPSGVPIKLRIPLRSIQSNMKVTLGEMQAQALPAFIGNVTAPRMVAFCRNAARRICSSWYTSQVDNYRLCGLGPSSGTDAYSVDGTNKKITFTPSNKAISRLAVGDRVDLFRTLSTVPVRMNDTAVTAGGVVSGDGAGQTLSTRIRAFISAVDKVAGTAVIQFDPATSSAKFTTTGSLTASQLSTDTYLVWANSTVGGAAFTDIPGLNSWMKFGGSTNAENYLLGNEAVGTTSTGIVDIRIHPEFRSYYYAVNNVLSEHRLNLHLDRVLEAFEDEGHYIDTMVTTQGVIRAMAAQKEARMILDRTGRVSSLANEGEDGQGLTHHHAGRALKIFTSRWMEYGTMNGYRRANNWVRGIPPQTPGSQTMPGMEAGIPFEFLVPALTGLPTTQWPIMLNGAQMTDASQKPGHIRMTLFPDKQVRGMKLAGLTEERAYGQTTS